MRNNNWKQSHSLKLLFGSLGKLAQIQAVERRNHVKSNVRILIIIIIIIIITYIT